MRYKKLKENLKSLDDIKKRPFCDAFRIPENIKGDSYLREALINADIIEKPSHDSVVYGVEVYTYEDVEGFGNFMEVGFFFTLDSIDTSFSEDDKPFFAFDCKKQYIENELQYSPDFGKLIILDQEKFNAFIGS